MFLVVMNEIDNIDCYSAHIRMFAIGSVDWCIEHVLVCMRVGVYVFVRISAPSGVNN